MIVLVPERGTEAWRIAHRGHICASDAGAILAAPGTKRFAALINRLVLDFEGHGLHTDEHPEPWAERHEVNLKSALARYQHATGLSVEVPGFVTHDKYTVIGCSPHGLIGAYGAVHFRVRNSLRTWYDAAKLANADYARVQLTMFVCERLWTDVCDFWDGGGRVPDKIRRRRIDFDHAWVLANVIPSVLGVWSHVREILASRRDDSSPGSHHRPEETETLR